MVLLVVSEVRLAVAFFWGGMNGTLVVVAAIGHSDSMGKGRCVVLRWR